MDGLWISDLVRIASSFLVQKSCPTMPVNFSLLKSKNYFVCTCLLWYVKQAKNVFLWTCWKSNLSEPSVNFMNHGHLVLQYWTCFRIGVVKKWSVLLHVAK